MIPAALLLDLDGTLVDSEPRHVETHRRFLATQGITASDELCVGNIGKGDRHFYQRLIDERGMTADAAQWVAEKTRLLMESYRIDGLALRPGVHDLLDAAYAAGIPCMLVTSAERALARVSLAVTGLDRRLMGRICHEDVSAHKPDPAPYRLAAQRLGVPTDRCLVVEDSVAGVRSGKAAGCQVIGFPGLVGAAELLAAGASRVIASLSEVFSAPASSVPRLQARAAGHAP